MTLPQTHLWLFIKIYADESKKSPGLILNNINPKGFYLLIVINRRFYQFCFAAFFTAAVTITAAAKASASNAINVTGTVSPDATSAKTIA